MWLQKYSLSVCIGFRTDPIWVPSQLSVCSHTPTLLATTISRFPYNFFQIWPFIFCQHTIHQVIWPSLGTLLPSVPGACFWDLKIDFDPNWSMWTCKREGTWHPRKSAQDNSKSAYSRGKLVARNGNFLRFAADFWSNLKLSGILSASARWGRWMLILETIGRYGQGPLYSTGNW